MNDKTQGISFQEIPQRYDALLSQLQDVVIQKLYSKINFLYYPYMLLIQNKEENNTNKNLINDHLFDFLTKYKLITYQVFNYYNIESKIHKNTVDVVLCVEKHCLLIDQINFTFFNEIIQKLKEQEIALINLGINNSVETLEEEQAKEEIDNFCSMFTKEINQNDFVKMTINPIVGYIIRRFFYPTKYFKDPSFFIFDEKNYSKDQKYKTEFINLLENEKSIDLFNEKLEYIYDEIEKNKYDDDQIHQYSFKENDFIVLRTVYSNEKALFYLVIHIESFYIFLMKKMQNLENEHEFNFCLNYSHRCLVPFYGFVKNNQKIIALIYEYMCNDSLHYYLMNNNEKITEMYSLMTIVRVFQGINYLHINSLIHRDLKPFNILLDHDFVPFISDFETIRRPINEKETQEKMTFDIGSVLYTSPEQDQGEFISYPTDIYSFGAIIYFIFEKKNLFQSANEKSDKNRIKSIKNASKDIDNLYQKCINFLPKKRPCLSDIKSILSKEVNKFFYFEDVLQKDVKEINLEEVILYIYENFLFLKEEKSIDSSSSSIDSDSSSSSDSDDMDLINFQVLISEFCTLYSIKVNKGNSFLFYHFGKIYEKGCKVKRNYFKAMKYYESAAKEGFFDAYFELGSFYYNGIIEQNYVKAKEYFELAAKHNNIDAIFHLGLIYYNGYGVIKNYAKAEEYFNCVSESNNVDALVKLANIYYDGTIEKNYLKAIKYFELAAQQHDLSSLFNLGNIYYSGYGVAKDYIKAKKYYKLSLPYNESRTFYNLGNIYYFGGYGVNRNYIKALKYYKQMPEIFNSDGLYQMGNIYYNGGYGVEKNYIKAIEYYKESANLFEKKALIMLGIIYYDGEGVDQDYIKAKEYFEEAKEFHIIAQMYKYGIGVQKNINKAINYYLLAANENDASAYNILGNIYYFGEYGEKDYIKAKKYYELGASFWDAISMCNLAMLYSDGFALKRDYSRAIYYLNMASKAGHSIAITNLGLIYLNGYGIERNYLKGKQYFENAAQIGNILGYFYLGIIYKYGIGFQKDYLKAIKYFELAAQDNYVRALLNLGIIYKSDDFEYKDYYKSKKYFELAAEQNYSNALFYLGYFYSMGDFFDINIPKAINYFTKCMEIQEDIITIPNYKENYSYTQNFFNKYRYRSSNDLGLIFLNKDLKKAEEYLKFAGLNEYPFGQNNYGLFSQFYLNIKLKMPSIYMKRHRSIILLFQNTT